MTPVHGEIFLRLEDPKTGELLDERHHDNIVVLDAGILAACLFAGVSRQGAPNPSFSTMMLAVGTGASGNLLSPNAPQSTQRALNNEIARKAFSSVLFRNSSGIAVSYPTNILDLTTSYAESEAVGPLNEMGLISPYSVSTPTPIPPGAYDPTVNLYMYDGMITYLPFSVVSKPNLAVLTITYRLTF